MSAPFGVELELIDRLLDFDDAELVVDAKEELCGLVFGVLEVNALFDPSPAPPAPPQEVSPATVKVKKTVDLQELVIVIIKPVALRSIENSWLI